MSRKLRRSAGPAFTSIRCSGQKSTARKHPTSSASLVTGAPFFLHSRRFATSCEYARKIISCSRLESFMSSVTSKKGLPNFTISRSRGVRKLFPAAIR